MPTIVRKFIRLNPKTESLHQKDRAKVYNTAKWRNLRDLKLMMSPLCEKCLESGRTTEAIDVHHIVSFMSVEDPEKRRFLAFDFDNLQSLCKQCHQKIHNYGKKMDL